MQSIPVIITGFGQWVRTRTIVPFLKRYTNEIHIAVVTSLLKEEEFDEEVRPIFEKNGWRVPQYIPNFIEAFNKTYPEGEKPIAVLVTTPNGLHFEEAKTAIQAGYHVYVERPIVTKDDPLPELIKLADKHKVLLFTGAQRRLEAPFQYLQKVVAEKYYFGKLKSIRCRFAARHCLKGWRRYPALSGGGIVIDSGYHLLDIVAWLVDSVGIQIPENLKGAVRFGFDEPSSSTKVPVETEAFGYIELPKQIFLSFDFSYNAPENSILEQIELYDQDFTRVCLTRDQAVRTSLPATITHQLSNGKFVDIETHLGQGIRAEAIRFAAEAQNMAPIRKFIDAVRRRFNNVRATRDPLEAQIEARNSLSTWRLVRGIYQLASRRDAKQRRLNKEVK